MKFEILLIVSLVIVSMTSITEARRGPHHGSHNNTGEFSRPPHNHTGIYFTSRPVQNHTDLDLTTAQPAPVPVSYVVAKRRDLGSQKIFISYDVNSASAKKRQIPSKPRKFW